MNEIALHAKTRAAGKKAVKQIRKQGFVPGVFYSKGEENIIFYTDTRSLRPIVYTAQTRIIKLQVGENPEVHDCVLKDVSFDPVSDKIVHLDLLGLQPGQKIAVEVPFVLKGQASGVRAGGLMQQALHKVKVKCLPTDIKEKIEVNVTKLEIGQSIQIKDIDFGSLEYEISPESVICHVSAPRVTAKTDAPTGKK